MMYTSTRDKSVRCSFEDALCMGYAPGGGLFVPEALPAATIADLEAWSRLTYPELSCQVLRRFIAASEIADADLKRVCTQALVGFDDPNQAVPVVRVGSLHVAELFHGPTFCFKDLGMQVVVGLLSFFATKRQRRITLLVSTTGDTGPAAVQAVSDLNNPLLTIVVHYPEGQISALQRKQLTTTESKCVRVVAFQGGGDDMDRPIKRILAGQDRSGTYLIVGVNSYNIGRPLAQTVHFIWTYLRVSQELSLPIGDPKSCLDVVLPTGAMGNIAGAYMAKKMGLPLGRLCSGCNANDITNRVMQTGEFHRSPHMVKTLSDAINIQVPYNFERLLFYLTDGDHVLLADWMTTMDSEEKITLSEDWLGKLQQEFSCARVDDDEMCATLRELRREHNYLADPHTAVAFAAAKRLGYRLDKPQLNPCALLSTASPCKFEESVTVAIGKEGWKNYLHSEFPERAKAILSLPEAPVTIYEADENESLEQSQLAWEANARQIIDELKALV